MMEGKGTFIPDCVLFFPSFSTCRTLPRTDLHPQPWCEGHCWTGCAPLRPQVRCLRSLGVLTAPLMTEDKQVWSELNSLLLGQFIRILSHYKGTQEAVGCEWTATAHLIFRAPGKEDSCLFQQPKSQTSLPVVPQYQFSLFLSNRVL